MMMLWSLLLSRALAGEADVHYQQARLHLRRNWAHRLIHRSTLYSYRRLGQR